MAPKESIAATSPSLEEALLKADALRPSISLTRPNNVFAGEKLNKLKSNYKKWNKDMTHYLAINGLLSYVLGEKSKPSPSSEPRAHENWIENDRFAYTAIAMNVSDENEAELDMAKGAKVAWDTLRERHQNEGPVRQVDLLHTALNVKCKKGMPLPQTCHKICNAVDQAFMMGDFTVDLFRCIAIINTLEDFPHICSSILWDLRASTKEKEYTSKDIRHYLESEETLHSATKSFSVSDITLTAHTKSPNVPTCSNCKRQGHSNLYCISPGGGMAGKTIQESKDARYKDRENARTHNTTKSNSNTRKIAVNVKDSTGKVFIIHVDPSDISTPSNNAKSEFASLASDHPESILPDSLENIEWSGWLALEEELKTSLDWKKHTKPVDIAAISEISPLQQNKRTPLTLDDLPFYVDTGATVHISPEQSDFLTLRPIAARSVKGVGGSSVTAIGLGDIKLRIARGAHIILKNVLFIPNAAVRLISVSTLARDSQAVAHFDETSCWITNKSTGAIVARGSLLPTKNLYSLDLLSPHAEHALTISHAPDLATWHRRLGHANYQAVREMAKNGLIPGMPTNFPPANPPKCEFCVLGKQTKTPVPKTRKEGPGHKATRVLEKVWVDLSGQHMRSRTGNEYVMDIVDDYTSQLWSIPLKNKDDSFPELKAWELARESETGKRLEHTLPTKGN
jgi:hypothetical protein